MPSGRKNNSPHATGTAKPAPNLTVRRLMETKARTPSEWLAAEARGSRIRQEYAEIDPAAAQAAKLRARITLPKVKGYWE